MRFRRLLLYLLVAAGLCFAQTATSRISGTVMDSSGAVVPGASVTVINESTGARFVQLTTAAGLYSFPALPAGSYTIEVSMQGFKTARTPHNVLVVETP